MNKGNTRKATALTLICMLLLPWVLPLVYLF